MTKLDTSPLSGGRGAHGRFDDIATSRSPTWWAIKHRAAEIVAAVG